MRIWRWFISLSCVFMLVGCATPTVNSIDDAGTFARAGRFAVNYQSSLQKPYAAQGNFNWLDHGKELDIDLSNPMGSIVARVSIRPGGATINYADGTIDTASTPDELLAKVWGQAIPVSGLRYWIRGALYPQAGVSNEKHDKQGDLASFEQLGWNVTLSDYDSAGPRKIRLVRADAQSRLNLRFIVN